MADEDEERTDASEERPVNEDVFVRVRLGTLRDVIGLLSSHAEQRREATRTIEEVRRRIALAGHPAGSAIGTGDDLDDEAG